MEGEQLYCQTVPEPDTGQHKVSEILAFAINCKVRVFPKDNIGPTNR